MAKTWQRVGRWQDGLRGFSNYQRGLTISNGDRTVKVTGCCADSQADYDRLYKGEEVLLPRLDAQLAWEDARVEEMEAQER